MKNVYCKCTDLTVYAQWSPISYSIAYDLAGGASGATVLKGNATVYKPWAAATREGVTSVK